MLNWNALCFEVAGVVRVENLAKIYQLIELIKPKWVSVAVAFLTVTRRSRSVETLKLLIGLFERLSRNIHRKSFTFRELKN